MNKAALARAKEAEEAEARGELADAGASTAAEATAANARAAAAETALAGLRAAVAVAAPPHLACPALPAEVWAEVLSAVGTRCASCPHLRVGETSHS